MALTMGNLAAIGVLIGGGVLIYGSATSEQSPRHLTVQEQFIICAMHADHSGVERALAQGAHVDGREASGITALVIAAAEGNLPMVRLLLHHGADVNVEMPAGNSVLAATVYGECDLETIQTLLEAGADPNGPSRLRPLVAAAERQNAEAMQLLLAGGADPNLADEDGATPLQTATTSRRGDLVQLLRQAGAVR